MAEHDHHKQAHGHDHHGTHPPKKRGVHRDWRLWVAVVLMLAGMFAYIMTMDEADVPGGDGEPVPADAPAAP